MMITKTYWDEICQFLFSALSKEETLTLNLEAECTDYLRINNGKLRQCTQVEQFEVTANLQSLGRSTVRSWNLSCNRDLDFEMCRQELKGLREEISQIPEDLHLVPISNSGQSCNEYSGEILSYDQISLELLAPAIEMKDDLTGILSQGPMARANANSLGQSHWFKTQFFSFDYSLFSGPRAVKGIFSHKKWSASEWQKELSFSRNLLEKMNLPIQKVPKGKHRVYLAPGAIYEMTTILNWGALSYSAYRTGQSAFKRLADNELSLSPKFSLRENFSLGFIPQFNFLGEMPAMTVDLLKEGQLQQLLISSRSAKEFGAPSNQASQGESLRSPEILPGTLPEDKILSQLGTGLYLSNLHYLNWSDRSHARVTGMTRYACFWVEDGKIKGPIEDLRFDVSLYDIFGKNLIDITDKQTDFPETGTYSQRNLGGYRLPGALVQDFEFTL